MAAMMECPLVQIAGVVDATEAAMLVSLGCKCLGFPLRLPVNIPDLSEDEAAKLIGGLPKDIVATLICYENNADAIRGFVSALGVRCVQLHGPVETAELERLKRICPGLYVIKSLIVRSGNLAGLLGQVDEETPFVDAFITDSHNPATGADGATGIVHDWGASQSIVQHSRRPVILAGGLNCDNVRDAILKVRPAGVDVHTGIEGADGRKEPGKAKAFMLNALAAFAEVHRRES